MASPRIDIRTFIDERPFSRYQLLVVALCTLIVFLDGFDTQASGFVAPAISKEFLISRAELSPVFSASLVGMMLGALAGGPVSDRFGRRPVLLAGLFYFGVMSLLTALAPDVKWLLILRLMTGLGLGCVMPNAIALTSEFAPERVRATTVMLMFCGFSLGAALGGFVAAALIRDLGWQSVFIVGGVLPCLAAVAAWYLLPESPSFLVVRNAPKARVLRILRKFGTPIADDAVFTVRADEKQSQKSPVRQLFAEKRAWLTVLLWIVFFMSLMDMYFLANWLPTVISDTGVPVESAALITSMLQIGGTVGTLVLGRVFDRVSPFRALAAIYLLAAVFIVLVGGAGQSVPMLVVTIFGAGFCVIGGQIGANALAAQSYPTAMRVTGVGWALGIGRAGSVVGPVVGGLLLSQQWEVKHLFMVAAVPVVIASVASFAISLSKRQAAEPRALDDASSPSGAG